MSIDAYLQHNHTANTAPRTSNNGQVQLHRLAFALHVHGTLNNTAIRHKFPQTNLVGACDDGASSPLMSRLFKRRNVLSLAGVDAAAAAAGAAPRAGPLPAPSGACCSLRLDGGEPALPPLVDAECAAPPETGGGVARGVRAPTCVCGGGGGWRWVPWAPPPPSGLCAVPETMAARRSRESGREGARRSAELLEKP
jgi:hypothetical protein